MFKSTISEDRREPSLTPRVAVLDVGGVDPEIRPVALEGPVEEGLHALVEFGAVAADLALRDVAHAQSLDQIVDRARGDALHVGLLDDGDQGPLGGPPRLQELREVAAAPELGDAQVDAAGARVPAALAVAVAAVLPSGGSLFIVRDATARLGVDLHELLGHEVDHLAQDVDIGALFGQFGQCDSGVGLARRSQPCSFMAPSSQIRTSGKTGAVHTDYIVRFYNDHRLSSTLNYVSPNAFERAAATA